MAAAIAIAPPEPPFPDDGGDQRNAQIEALFGRARDRLGLAALLGLDAREGAGGVDQGHDRKREAVGEPHQPDRLAIAFGPRHAEIVLEAACRIAAFLMPDQHHLSPVERREAADDRRVLAELAVARQRHEVGERARRHNP